uniref:Plastocyanin-like domain-containing protein n=1 Tax=Acrobeloides nanus TaxID=290746 RepID=A0A914ENA7_9BILA
MEIYLVLIQCKIAMVLVGQILRGSMGMLKECHKVQRMSQSPTLRDTILVPTGGYVVIRFRAKNPGWWFAHCHLQIHDMAGMAFAFRIGNGDEIPKPPEGFPHSCGIYEQPSLNLSPKSKTRTNKDLNIN